MEYAPVLEAIAKGYNQILGDRLRGIYVHGSIAFGCFHWEKSDIDFIAVVSDPLPQQDKLALLRLLDTLRPQAPKKGFEMSVVRADVCQNFVHPTPYELHFSNYWLARYLQDPLSLCGDEVKTDPDLAAHFTVIRHAGVVLCGRPISEIFGEVPREAYLDSICMDIRNAAEDVTDDPVYFILNLCRVYAYVKEGLVLSKEQGAQWGLRNLPEGYHALISAHLKRYRAEEETQTDPALELEFCDYMTRQIFGT